MKIKFSNKAVEELLDTLGEVLDNAPEELLKTTVEKINKWYDGHVEEVKKRQEFTEFEKALGESIRQYNVSGDFNHPFLKREAGKLLDIARKEFEKDLPKWHKSTATATALNDGFRLYDSCHYLTIEELRKLPKE